MSVTDGGIVRAGPLTIDLDALTVHVDGREVKLSALEHGILLFLARNAGRIMPTERVVAAVWGTEYVLGNMTAYANPLRTRVGRLRSKLGDGAAFIECLPGLGYRLVLVSDDVPIVPTPSPSFRERQIAYWRSEARQNWTLGFMDLARRCEGFASCWEFGEAAPCHD